MFEYQEINWKFQPLDDLNSIFLHQHTNMWIHSKYIYVCDDVRCRCALPCCYVLKIAGNKHGSSLKNPRWFHRYCLTLLDNMKTEQQQQQQKSKIQFEKKTNRMAKIMHFADVCLSLFLFASTPYILVVKSQHLFRNFRSFPM